MHQLVTPLESVQVIHELPVCVSSNMMLRANSGVPFTTCHLPLSVMVLLVCVAFGRAITRQAIATTSAPMARVCLLILSSQFNCCDWPDYCDCSRHSRAGTVFVLASVYAMQGLLPKWILNRVDAADSHTDGEEGHCFCCTNKEEERGLYCARTAGPFRYYPNLTSTIFSQTRH